MLGGGWSVVGGAWNYGGQSGAYAFSLLWKQVMEESNYLMCVVYNEREQTRCPFEWKERGLMHDFRVYGRMELLKKRTLGRSSLMKKIVIVSSVLE